MKKRIFALAVVMMMAVLAVTGCSTHESEIAKEQREAAAAMEEMFENQTPAEHRPDPTEPDAVVVEVFAVKSGDKGLVSELDSVPEVDDLELTRKLIEVGVLPETAEIIDYDHDLGVVDYTGVESLTPRQAQAVINTIKSADLEFDDQITLRLEGKDILTSGFCADYESITDDYAGGANDSDGSEGGPGVQ